MDWASTSSCKFWRGEISTPPQKTMPEINTERNMPGVWYCCRRTSTGSTGCDADCPFPAASAIFAGSIGGACFHVDRRRLQTADQSTPGADLRSGHLCSGRRGPCHMVLGGPWWKSIKKIGITAAKTGFFSFKLCTVDKVHAVRMFVPPETPTGFWSRPVEVGTNTEVEALLVSGRRGLLAYIRHWSTRANVTIFF